MKYYTIPLLSAVLLIGMFSTSEAFAEYINCDPDVSAEEYPICNYVDEWNHAQRFSQLYVDELDTYADRINSEQITYSEASQASWHKVKRDNPGLYEECEQIKQWVYQQLSLHK